MNANQLVDAILEGLPGLSYEEMDNLKEIVLSIVDEVKTGSPQVDVDEFEKRVNAAMRYYNFPVTFTRTDPELSRMPMPARCGFDGAVVRTPRRINRREFENIWNVLSHELVHVGQIDRSYRGNALKAYTSAHAPMFKNGQFDREAYHRNPEETTAYARSAVDMGRERGRNRDQILNDLRTGRLKYGHGQKADRRFAKHAAGYANALPHPSM